jgi:hypothetical protein
MNTTFFNFNTKTEVNPLENVDTFFINPYMLEGYKTLNIREKIMNLDETIVNFYNDLPVVLLPISVLDLGVVQIKYDEYSNGGKIIKGKLTLYFSFTESDNIIRINSVLVR